MGWLDHRRDCSNSIRSVWVVGDGDSCWLLLAMIIPRVRTHADECVAHMNHGQWQSRSGMISRQDRIVVASVVKLLLLSLLVS
jgi:hypothetical protein